MSTSLLTTNIIWFCICCRFFLQSFFFFVCCFLVRICLLCRFLLCICFILRCAGLGGCCLSMLLIVVVLVAVLLARCVVFSCITKRRAWPWDMFRCSFQCWDLLLLLPDVTVTGRGVVLSTAVGAILETSITLITSVPLIPTGGTHHGAGVVFSDVAEYGAVAADGWSRNVRLDTYKVPPEDNCWQYFW